MADLAEPQDVADNYRTLGRQETIDVGSWIKAASAELRGAITDLDVLVEANPIFAERVKSAVVLVCLRRLTGNWSSPFSFTREEISNLVSPPSESSGSGLPQGCFPDVICYPVT